MSYTSGSGFGPSWHLNLSSYDFIVMKGLSHKKWDIMSNTLPWRLNEDHVGLHTLINYCILPEKNDWPNSLIEAYFSSFLFLCWTENSSRSHSAHSFLFCPSSLGNGSIRVGAWLADARDDLVNGPIDSMNIIFCWFSSVCDINLVKQISHDWPKCCWTSNSWTNWLRCCYSSFYHHTNLSHQCGKE